MKQGVGVLPTPIESVVKMLLETKRALVRDSWYSKEHRGRRSITTERYELIAGITQELADAPYWERSRMLATSPIASGAIGRRGGKRTAPEHLST